MSGEELREKIAKERENDSRERIAKALARLHEKTLGDFEGRLWEHPQDWSGTLRLAWEIRSMLMDRAQVRAEILAQVEILRNLDAEAVANMTRSRSDTNVLADICEDFANELLYPWRYE